jgi:TPR repeat protein
MMARADYHSRLALRLQPAASRREADAPAPAQKNPPPPAADAEAHFVHAEGLRKLTLKISPDALVLYRQAAELGHAGAMHRIGVAYALGESVPKDDQKAVEWYRKAAEKGFAEAQYDLGVRYILGRGVAKDERTGLEWYRKAAAQGWQEAIDALREHDAARK